MPREQQRQVRETAGDLVMALRARGQPSGVDGLVKEYALSSDEGVALMCLAEALLRIPDSATRDALIRDKIADGNWHSHIGRDRPLFVNAATWGLLVTGRLVDPVNDQTLGSALRRLIARAGEPVIRSAVNLAMRLLGEQFVLGQTIDKAIQRASRLEQRGYTFSYDMLGEAAMTAQDAQAYYDAYANAIRAIGRRAGSRGPVEGPGISIKLSALHPRYSRAQASRVMQELLPRVRALALQASEQNIGFNIDAEEADRLELSLDILERLALDPKLKGWDGLGFVVQAYGKRCPLVIDWLVDLARRSGHRLMIRLVKGAYWDTEIKRAHVEGLEDFPVYTRKLHTDVAYLACAKKLLASREKVYPQFATHNAQSIAAIYHMAGPDHSAGDYEFQCLHGMGQPVYDEVIGPEKLARPCRIYAPVGTHDTLLAYLVRRLLENGANSSFINRITDPDVPLEALIADPVETVSSMPSPGAPHPDIALPCALYPDRRNAEGHDLSDEHVLARFEAAFEAANRTEWRAAAAVQPASQPRPVCNPGNHSDIVGEVIEVTPEDVPSAMARAAASSWAVTAVDERARCLERAADLMEAEMAPLCGLVMREAGKTLSNAVAEVREAVDFLRYYAVQARRLLDGSTALGPVVCISPWNFPLAIFTGQVSAALVAGNPILAKPAEETPLIAAQGVRILHEAGIPEDALQLLPGDGHVGAALVAARQTAGVMFTGSTEVARLIQRQLADRLSVEGAPIPFIAETGGQNAMVVDSSALAEQVVADILESAFDSAGQRCSALRILCIQEDVADRTLAMLKGAMEELRIAPTDSLSTDIGPVISEDARKTIESHIERMADQGRAVHRMPLPSEAGTGTFVAPAIIEIDDISQLGREVFGPVLHVLRYKRSEIDSLMHAINATGYGLTFGVHSRLGSSVEHVLGLSQAGNRYVNRNIVGAIVGVQPFGGSGLSGTGPKAGGPLYLTRLVREAPHPFAGGNASQDEALSDFIDWLKDRKESQAASLASQYGRLSPLGVNIDLPGPVGEHNFYRLQPRGTVLLRAATQAGLFQQISAVLATGNRGLVSGGVELPPDLPDSVRKRLSAPDDMTIGAALIEGEEAERLAFQNELASREGPIATLQAASSAACASTVAYRTDWLCHEVSTSINTAAAGGNASLMTIAL